MFLFLLCCSSSSTNCLIPLVFSFQFCTCSFLWFWIYVLNSLWCFRFNVEWHSILSLVHLLEGFVLQWWFLKFLHLFLIVCPCFQLLIVVFLHIYCCVHMLKSVFLHICCLCFKEGECSWRVQDYLFGVCVV